MTGAQDTRSEHPPAAEEFKEDASQKQASEQAENETTKDMEGIEADNDEQAKHVTMQADSAEGTKALDAKQETPNSRKLIVPKNCHIPIKLTMTDIFKQSKERQAAQVAEPSKPGECQASTPGENDVLQVKANIWMSQEELKRTKTKTPPNTNAPEASKQQVELPPKPASWGKVSVVTPEMQDPPKKRGRKPKHESEKATTDGKGNKCKKANMNGEKNQEGASTKQPAKTTLSPSQRTRQYLLNQKKKRSSEASSTKGGEKGAKEDDAEKPPRKVRRTSKTNDETKKPVESAGDAVAEPETKKRRKTTEQKQLDHQEGKKSDAGKHEKKTKKTEKKQKDEREAERKKRYSRKSAAYHAAFRATQGTNEEKKAAAKKAHCLHLELEYLHARMMCSCNGCVSINGVGVHLS